jgi:predicted nucleic acid-binding protein
VNDVWVVNASPIIVLAKIGHLDLLTSLSCEVCIPQAVVDEISAGPDEDPARKAIENQWGSRAEPLASHSDLIEWGLGPGETSVLAVARERAPATAILDDAAARRCAQVIGVPVIGTVGVIIRAKKRGLIRSASETLKALTNIGLHLDYQVIAVALRSVGESWET